ncbi:histidine N-acetyltransferase isoform X2 [Scyliorhinus canicula]|uniref:histidine N-acetyltransferase isoform X2 n=1 Tax=Scyliorhinus canicula TaxID=7830 RepID=UPI0018F403F9|nr:histidine N-acetyltransferase isoform X2 [Scyliorhinus canicula]
MEGASHGLEFCLAKEADFEQVMSISEDIYGGIDYLPAKYHAWLQEPDRRVILAKKKGQVIALVSANVVDDGCTAVVEGLRVAPMERGKGIAGIIQQYCFDLIRAQFPEVKVRRYTRSGYLGPETLAKFRLICKQEILLLRFELEEIRPKLDAAISQLKACGTEWEDPILLRASDVQRVFLNPNVVGGVLPGKTIVLDWAPYRPLQSNLEILLKKNLIWLADGQEEPRVLSLGATPYRIPMGADYNCLSIDLFGKHFPSARNQFLAQLQRGIGTLQGSLYCLLYLDPCLWQQMYSFCQISFGLHQERDFEGQNVLETEM